MLWQVNDSGLAKLFRSRWFICLLLALVLAFNFVIRWRLREMPLERDEGEYAYAGQLILQGIPPYQLVYNMKFPGVYYAYALLMSLFGESAAGIHIGIILITSITAILVFLIGRELFGNHLALHRSLANQEPRNPAVPSPLPFDGRGEGQGEVRVFGNVAALFAAATFICLSALPKAAGLAGHATHFVCLFVCAGLFALLLAQRKKNYWWFVSGTAFGLATLMTQQALFFPVFILAWLFFKEFHRRPWPGLALVVRARALLFCGGCVFPFLVTAAGFACAGVWGKFVFWTFDYARHYVGIFPLGAAPGQFAVGIDPVFGSGTFVWFSGFAGLIFLLRQRVRRAPVELAAIIFLAGLAATCPGFYFRNHYFIMTMPGLALLNAAFILTIGRTFKKAGLPRSYPWVSLGLAVLILGNLVLNNREIWFQMSPIAASRKLYGISPYPDSIPVAEYLKNHTSPKDKIAVLGSEPELFFLSDRRSASGYIYIYSLTEPQPLAPQMRAQFISEIEAARPKYVVFVNIFSSWYSVILPESLQSAAAVQGWWWNYSTNYTLAGAVKIHADQPSQFLWDEQLVGHPDATNDDLLIYRRKP